MTSSIEATSIEATSIEATSIEVGDRRGPVIASTGIGPGHDGRAEVVVELLYPNGGRTWLSIVRDHPAMRLEQAVKKITSDTATIWGMADRGVLGAGKAADVVVFDPATIGRGPEVSSDDFPGDGIRWIRHQVGVDSVVVNGTVTWTADDGYVAEARGGTIATR